MAFLLDVNVLVALAWPNHVHHNAAHRWFASAPRSWATCSITQTGFVRVSSNPATTPGARTPAEAIAHLQLIVALPGHEFWSDDVSIAEERSVARNRLMGHRQVTDAHLLALAVRHGGQLATFDRGIAELVEGLEERRVVEVLGVRAER